MRHSRLVRRTTLCLLGATLLASGCSDSPAPSAGPEASPSPAASTPGPAGSASASASPSPSPARSSGEDDPRLAAFYGQRLGREDCGDGFECARLRVPLDYDDPAAQSIRLALVRLPASGPGARVGSLVVNPGGPGGSGIDYARRARTAVTAPVRARFDVVGFDPRGVGQSEPVRCLTDEQTDEFIAADGSPDDAGEERRLLRLAEDFAARCEQRAGVLLPHVGTPDAARDMDVLRAALGDRRLHYLGKSYGTYLGATYAGLFPDKVGSMVLDGAIDPRVSARRQGRAQAAGFEQALAAFVDDCVTRADCPIGDDRTEGLAAIDQLLARADAEPLESADGRVATQALVVLGIVAAMYDETNGWPALQVGLRQAIEAGDASVLLLLADFYTDRDEEGRYTNNQNDVIYAVNCLDRPERGDLDDLRAVARSFSRVSPRFGAYIAWGGLPCSVWPAQPEGGPTAVHAPGARPILVIGTTRDPATPYQWAKALARQLDSGVLLTYEGDGHTAYARGSGCIDSAVEDYLLRDRLPRPADSRCA